MGNSAKRDGRRVSRAEQQLKALELRKSGATHDEIAKKLGLKNRSVAWKMVRAAIKGITLEPASEVLSLELERLDAVLLGCWAKAKKGDPQAVDRVLRIMDRRAAYLGLDQPKGLKVEVDRELEGFIGRLREGLDPDVFERVLAVATGVAGTPGVGEDPSGEGAEEGDDGDEPVGA
jgi:hypothetical protein